MAELSVDTASLERDIRRTRKKLETLAVKVQKQVLRKATRAAGAPVVKALRNNAPTDRRRLRRTMGQQVRTMKDGSVEGTVGQNRRAAKRWNAPHIHLVDQPTRSHSITGAFETSDGRLIRGTFSHPGTRGHDFVSETQQQTERQSLDAFAKKASQEVDKEAAKLGGMP